MFDHNSEQLERQSLSTNRLKQVGEHIELLMQLVHSWPTGGFGKFNMCSLYQTSVKYQGEKTSNLTESHILHGQLVVCVFFWRTNNTGFANVNSN